MIPLENKGAFHCWVLETTDKLTLKIFPHKLLNQQEKWMLRYTYHFPTWYFMGFFRWAFMKGKHPWRKSKNIFADKLFPMTT